MVDIQFDKETDILIMKYDVSVDSQDIEDFIAYLADQHDLPKHLKVLHDVGPLPSTMKMMDLIQFAKEMKRGTQRFESVRAAVYTTNSLTLTLSHLYERLNLDRNTRFKTFRSQGSAVAWLLGL